MDTYYRMELVFEIPDCTLYDITDGRISIIYQAPLAIYQLKSYNLIVLKISEWQYSLSKDIPVMFQKQNSKKMYALPKQNGNFGLLLGPNTTDEQEIILESIFYAHTNFIVSTPQGDDEQDVMIAEEEPAILQNQQQEIEQNQTSKRIQGYIQKGGDLIRTGLLVGAGIIAQGIKSGGKLIRSGITEQSNKEIKPQTLEKVQIAKQTSSAVLIFSQTQFQALLEGSNNIASQIGDRVSQTEAGKIISTHKNYEDAKNVAKGTIYAISSIYDGMYQSLCTIGRGFQHTTTKVVFAKYGQDAAQLAHESMDAAGNVIGIAGVYKTENNRPVN